MYLITISDFVGRFHPVLVHLPIGILLFGCLFHLFTKDRRVITIIIFWGAVSALFSTITGYLLSLSGDYEGELVNLHQWMGIVTTVVSVVMYLLLKKKIKTSITKGIALLLVLLITITGHYGGSLTHGEGYLLSGLDERKTAIPPIVNIQDAQVYANAIQPLLEARCYSCHGAGKMKGKLRLDLPEFIMQGGESGKVIVAGKPGESEMINRLLLPLSDEDHMPPKEKIQLTAYEIKLVDWWVMNGADFNKKFKELPQPDNIKPVLVAFQYGDVEQQPLPALPVEKGTAPDPKILQQLNDAGIVAVPVMQNSNYLSVNFVTAYSTADSIMQLLQPISDNIVWLNLSGTDISDNHMQYIMKLKNIRRLYLANTSISDKGLSALKQLSHLEYLNLSGTPITAAGLSSLAELKKLKTIYLYQSKVTASDWPGLQKIFSGVMLDSGGYSVPTLATDTSRIKY